MMFFPSSWSGVTSPFPVTVVSRCLFPHVEDVCPVLGCLVGHLHVPLAEVYQPDVVLAFRRETSFKVAEPCLQSSLSKICCSISRNCEQYSSICKGPLYLICSSNRRRRSIRALLRSTVPSWSA